MERPRLAGCSRCAGEAGHVTHGARYRAREVTVAAVIDVRGVRVGLAIRGRPLIVFVVRTCFYRDCIPIMRVRQRSFDWSRKQAQQAHRRRYTA